MRPLKLREIGIGPGRAHIVTWLYNGARDPFDKLIGNDIDIAVGSLSGIAAVAHAARMAETGAGPRESRYGFWPQWFLLRICYSPAVPARRNR